MGDRADRWDGRSATMTADFSHIDLVQRAFDLQGGKLSGASGRTGGVHHCNSPYIPVPPPFKKRSSKKISLTTPVHGIPGSPRLQ